MKRRYILGVVLWITAQILYAQSTVTIGKTMYQIWIGDKLYFLSSAYLPQQVDPLDEKLWMLDAKANRLRYIVKLKRND